MAIAAWAAWAALSAGAAQAAVDDGEKPVTLAVFSNMGSFKASGAEADGTQNIGYLQLIYSPGDWGAGVTSSLAATDYVSPISPERLKRSGMTDTSIVTFYNMRVGDVMTRFGVDLGLPTGKASQTSKELVRNIADDINQDLLLVNSYGAGLNVAGHLAVSYTSGGLTWGLGARYLVAGAYDPMSDMEKDKFDPGDSLLGIVSLLYEINPDTRILFSYSRTIQARDKQDGKDIFRNGDAGALELRLMREWEEGLTAALTLSSRAQDKNERLYSQNVFKTETGNSNANSAEAAVEAAWKQSGKLTLTGAAGYKSVQANGYPEKDYLYDGGRTRWFAEPGARWSLARDITVSAKLRYAQISDNQDNFSPAGATYKVTTIDLGLIMGF